MPINIEMHRLLGSDSVGRRVRGVRRRPALAWVIEPLECRVVPATIPVTSLLDSGPGTLRAAIEQADLATDHDTISFDPSVTGTIVLTSALPDLSTDIVISGPGPSALTVARSGATGTPAFRNFTVPSDAVVAISGLTITGGSATNGGGIDNAGSLSLVNTIVSGNSATGLAGTSDGGDGVGGGIENFGTLSVTDSTVSGNSATGGSPGNIDGSNTSVGGAGGGGGIENFGTLSVTNSTFSGNSATGAAGVFLGGGSGGGGAIQNSGTLSVTGSTFSGNAAAAGYGYLGSPGGAGGGIENSGTLSVTSSTFSRNAVSGGSGILSTGGAGGGGGIESSGTLSVSGSTFSGNSATGGSAVFSGGGGGGGGIENAGTLSVANSTFSGNSATGGRGDDGGVGGGGGIENSGTLSVASSTFSSNSAMGGYGNDFGPGGSGGGGGIENSDTLSVTSSTFSGNSANGGPGFRGSGSGGGGGIENSGALSVANSTFSGNSASGGTIYFGTGVGGGIESSGTVSISYATVADNSAASGGGIAITTGSGSKVVSINSIFENVQGGNVFVAAGSIFSSLGHNLFSDTPGFSLDPTDLVNTDPLLGPLADNGGPTFTRALLPGSPAINAGIPVIGITADQRGAPLPHGSAPDIGAFQVQPPLTVTSLRRYGVHRKPTVLVLTFNLPLDTSRAEDLANYRLVSARPDHRLGTRDDRVISILSAQYDAASQTVALRPKQRLKLRRTYRLTVIGMPPAGLTTTVGAYLEGAGTGQPGTNYMAAITRKSLVLFFDRPDRRETCQGAAWAGRTRAAVSGIPSRRRQLRRQLQPRFEPAR